LLWGNKLDSQNFFILSIMGQCLITWIYWVPLYFKVFLLPN
jgi:hypothetical protein